MTYLHVTNGDGAASILAQTGLSGTILPWRDPMHHGPYPAGLSLAALSTLRAAYLAGPQDDPAPHEEAFQSRDAEMLRASEQAAVVLWFEHDLLDQLQILQILDLCAQIDLGTTRLEMICIDRFEGVSPFRGIGQLTPVQMATLFDRKRAVTQTAMALAQRGWAAFRSDDPRALTAFLQTDLSALPFLKHALERHLREFPSARSGLSQTERQLLRLIASGISDPIELFRKNMALETALFIGDWRTYSTLHNLCQGGLLSCDPTPFWHPPKSKAELADFRAQRLTLTATGRAILNGEESALDTIETDIWLGGVHLRSGQPIWVWDEAAQSFDQHPAKASTRT